MKCTKDVENTNNTQKEKIKTEEGKRTSNILDTISKHKLITTIVAMFISFSVLNVVLILNFMKILENSIYI